MHLSTEQKFTVGSSFKLAARLFGAKREIQEQDQLSLDGAWLWLHWGPNTSLIARCSRRQSLVSWTIHFSHFFITCLSLQIHTLTCACVHAHARAHTYTHTHTHPHTHKLALPLPCLILVKEMASFQGCFFCLIEEELTYNVVLISAT